MLDGCVCMWNSALPVLESQIRQRKVKTIQRHKKAITAQHRIGIGIIL